MPADHVARVVVAAATQSSTPLGVAHVTGHPRPKFNTFLGALEKFGYRVPQVDYVPWASALEQYVHTHLGDMAQQHALMPLYHFVTADLPSDTKAPELDDTRATAVLAADAAWATTAGTGAAARGVTEQTMGVYLAYLVAIGFLPAPPKESAGNAAALPVVEIGGAQLAALARVGGRGGAA